MSKGERTIYQPIDPDIRKKLDPEYVAFHDKYMQYVPRDESKTWDGSARTTPSLPFGGAETVVVASVQDIELPNFKLRVYIPEAIDYRLAPEHPYPAAVNDTVESLRWVCSIGKDLFSLDLDRIAVGGTSAGANLAIVLCLKAAQDVDIRICFQLLIVPVIDNTATADGIWRQNCNAPWLTPSRMIWYRRMYMPLEDDWRKWDSSPHLAPEALLKRLPPTWMAISEQDLLAPEARLFAQQLDQLKVPVTVCEIKGGTHSILALCGILRKGKVMMREAAEALKDGFHHENYI
ncbi:hypothetical protein EG328_002871 [Venturia inaequalis]|uniref:Alpha/beta hydrolase fold-3 domain-containing protein n=1 Tax=Venturia inaequalis TaxID=5025 RepID=A0A8H3Z0Z9_VENIN|nr:hypothetical protein EG328_002871 [Venturia inaequalis]